MHWLPGFNTSFVSRLIWNSRWSLSFDLCRLDLLVKAGNAVTFECIPGAGHHSKAGAVIKPKVIEELTRRKLAFTEKNAGTLLVTIEGKATGGGKNLSYLIAMKEEFFHLLPSFLYFRFRLFCDSAHCLQASWEHQACRCGRLLCCYVICANTSTRFAIMYHKETIVYSLIKWRSILMLY